MADIGFDEVTPCAGVDIGSTAFMVVPLKGFNLIFHTLGHGAAFDVPNGLDVRDITDTMRRQDALTNTFGLLAGIPIAGFEPSKVFSMIARIWKVAQIPPNYRLLLVTGRHAGNHTLTLKTAHRRVTLSVSVLSPMTLQLVFRFLKYTGGDGVTKGSAWSADDAPDLLEKLNNIYVPQTNIRFEIKAAADFDISQSFDQPIYDPFVKAIIKPAADSHAHTTIFYVGRFSHSRMTIVRGCFFRETPSYIVLNDRPTYPESPVDDPVGVNMAHEVGHSLAGDDHPARDFVLMSRGKQAPKIDKALLLLMRKP